MIVNLSDGDVINLAQLPTRRINIVARVQPLAQPSPVGSVVFTLNDSVSVENVTPFALKGDSVGRYRSWTPTPGSYTLTATPYTKDNGEGEAGQGLTIHFTVIDEPSNQRRAYFRTNAGGEDYITPEGVIFREDFEDRSNFTNNTVEDIKGTTADGLYRTERISDQDQGSFQYYTGIRRGKYTLKLHFAEIYFGVEGGLSGVDPVGKRVFDVIVNGIPFLTNFDIAAEAGVATALVKTLELTLTGSSLTIEFRGKVNRPTIAAIEVIRSGPNQPPVVSAGLDKTIQLPLDSTFLLGSSSDPDGTEPDRAWTQVSGPAATLSGVNTGFLRLNNLVAGTYVFWLTVTDDEGLTASDEVTLVVLPAEDLAVMAYPNPVTDVLRVAADPESKAPVNIRLYDRFNKLYYEKQGVDLSEEHLINVSSFPANIYVLEVESAGAVKTVQVLKN